ncbi:unnamed protein product, partial [Ectocarpus sp. 4 AP-2014]
DVLDIRRWQVGALQSQAPTHTDRRALTAASTAQTSGYCRASTRKAWLAVCFGPTMASCVARTRRARSMHRTTAVKVEGRSSTDSGGGSPSPVVDLDELVHGTGQWENMQGVIRSTIKTLLETQAEHRQQIAAHEKQMRSMQALLVRRKKTDADKVRRGDLARATAVAAETGAVLAKLRKDVATVREDARAETNDLETRIKGKVSREHVTACLDGKANKEDVATLRGRIDRLSAATAGLATETRGVQALRDQAMSTEKRLAEVEARVQGCEAHAVRSDPAAVALRIETISSGLEGLSKRVDHKASASATERALEAKADKASGSGIACSVLIAALKSKADRADLSTIKASAASLLEVSRERAATAAAATAAAASLRLRADGHDKALARLTAAVAEAANEKKSSGDKRAKEDEAARRRCEKEFRRIAKRMESVERGLAALATASASLAARAAKTAAAVERDRERFQGKAESITDVVRALEERVEEWEPCRQLEAVQQLVDNQVSAAVAKEGTADAATARLSALEREVRGILSELSDGSADRSGPAEAAVTAPDRRLSARRQGGTRNQRRRLHHHSRGNVDGATDGTTTRGTGGGCTPSPASERDSRSNEGGRGVSEPLAEEYRVHRRGRVVDGQSGEYRGVGEGRRGESPGGRAPERVQRGGTPEGRGTSGGRDGVALATPPVGDFGEVSSPGSTSTSSETPRRRPSSTSGRSGGGGGGGGGGAGERQAVEAGGAIARRAGRVAALSSSWTPSSSCSPCRCPDYRAEVWSAPPDDASPAAAATAAVAVAPAARAEVLVPAAVSPRGHANVKETTRKRSGGGGGGGGGCSCCGFDPSPADKKVERNDDDASGKTPEASVSAQPGATRPLASPRGRDKHAARGDGGSCSGGGSRRFRRQGGSSNERQGSAGEDAKGPPPPPPAGGDADGIVEEAGTYPRSSSAIGRTRGAPSAILSSSRGAGAWGGGGVAETSAVASRIEELRREKEALRESVVGCGSNHEPTHGTLSVRIPPSIMKARVSAEIGRWSPVWVLGGGGSFRPKSAAFLL